LSNLLRTTTADELTYHNCRQNDELIDCDGVTDTWRCKVCGRIIREPCDFEEDYS